MCVLQDQHVFVFAFFLTKPLVPRFSKIIHQSFMFDQTSLIIQYQNLNKNGIAYQMKTFVEEGSAKWLNISVSEVIAESIKVCFFSHNLCVFIAILMVKIRIYYCGYCQAS